MAGYIIENIKDGIVKQWYYEDNETLPCDGSVTRLDTRTAMEYNMGHADGFINIPVDDLRKLPYLQDPLRMNTAEHRRGQVL